MKTFNLAIFYPNQQQLFEEYHGQKAPVKPPSTREDSQSKWRDIMTRFYQGIRVLELVNGLRGGEEKQKKKVSPRDPPPEEADNSPIELKESVFTATTKKTQKKTKSRPNARLKSRSKSQSKSR